MKKAVLYRGIPVFMMAMLALTWCVLAKAGGTAGVQYYGYDWLDGINGTSVETALNDITTMPNTGTSGSRTNMNVVHTIDSLNSAACTNKRCAVGVSAGSNAVWLDICPDRTSNSDCTGANSWSNIWNIVNRIAHAANAPAAIYFIDEPFNNSALQSNGQYVAWQYPSYVCTLRQAMAANNLNVPVYTILTTSSAANPADINEIRTQMPVTGCATPTSSRLDWVGIDNYTWTSSDQIYNAYNNVAPATDPQSPKWIIVPPTSLTVLPSPPTDAAIKNHIQPYWDVLFAYPNAPIIGVMNFRFDPEVIATSKYPATAALLSFMGNSLTK
ncbi:hypothetical protein [Burkholderia cepacia]|nr:hypothetical protein [Burkholderia cepacia]